MITVPGELPGTYHRINDLGPGLNAWFADLYAGRGPALTDLRPLAFAYFDATPNPDSFFFNFGPWALPRAATPVGRARAWEGVLSLVHDWERANPSLPPRHKGGGYYFAAVRDILEGDLDRGFLYMHQAVIEDARTYGPHQRTAARAFITLNARQPDQAFRQQVILYATALRGRLAAYRRYRGGQLTLPRLRGTFESDAELLEPLLALGFVIARLERLGDPRLRPIRDNPIAGLVFAGVILDLALVVDAVLYSKLRQAARRMMRRSGEPALGQLTTAYYASRGSSLRGSEVREIATAFSSDFDATLKELFVANSLPGRSIALSPEEGDFAITLGVRNHSAHRLARSALLGARFDRAMTRLFFALFAALEHLY